MLIQRRLNIISSTKAADADVTAYKPFSSVRGASCSLIEQFLSANQNPEVCSAMDFDQCIALSTDFYFLTPITDGPYLHGLSSRLANSKIVPNRVAQHQQKIGWERNLEAGVLCGEIDKDIAVILDQPIECSPP